MKNRVRNVASLHPDTVTNYRSHSRKRTRASSIRASQVAITKVDMRVWRAAMKLAKQDQTRIIVESPTEVLVVNQSKKTS